MAKEITLAEFPNHKNGRYNLSIRSRTYIDSNHQTMNAKTMAKKLNIDEDRVNAYMVSKRLIPADAPKPKRVKQKGEKKQQEMFDFDAFYKNHYEYGL